MAKNNKKISQTPNRSSPRGGQSGGSVFKTNRVTNLVNPGNTNIVTRNRGPISRSTKNGIIISNQERILGVTGASAIGTVAVTTAGLNPVSSTFNWSSKVLSNYGLYRFRRLRVCYVSTCSTTTIGDIVLGGFYDINDALTWASNPSPQTNLTLNQGSVSGPYWGSTLSHDNKGLTSNIMYEVDVERLHARLPWFRSAPAVLPGDAAAYNQAVPLTIGFTALFSGIASQTVGYLWVDYEIEAVHPQYGSLATQFRADSDHIIGSFDEQPLIDNNVNSFVPVRRLLHCSTSSIDGLPSLSS